MKHISGVQTVPRARPSVPVGDFHRSVRHQKIDKYSVLIYNGPTNALVCNKTLIQMSHIKTLKIIPTCFDHQMIIITELFDPG
jgi:hypothetical protein